MIHYFFLFAGKNQEMYASVRGLHAIGEHYWNVQHK